MEGVKLRLEDWPEGGYSVHDKPNARGEIILGTKATSIGYFDNEEETKKAYFVEDGLRWWRTGDIGEVNKYGHVLIIDRKKDLVKLQMGEYIALGTVSVYRMKTTHRSHPSVISFKLILNMFLCDRLKPYLRTVCTLIISFYMVVHFTII